MSAPQDHGRDPKNLCVGGAPGSAVTPKTFDLFGFVCDVIPIVIAGIAYAISSQFIPMSGGPVDAARIQEYLTYSVTVSVVGGAFGLVGGFILAIVMSNATEQDTDQRLLFFAVFPLVPMLGLLTILWFGLNSATAGIVFGSALSALAVIPILLPFTRGTARRGSTLIDAAFVAFSCSLGAELTREALGGEKGLGGLALKAMYSFDMSTTFYVIFVIALLMSALALVRRARQHYLSQGAI
jgi:ABC-type nitrate/sulfonate/bicarbonate transport system permease component